VVQWLSGSVVPGPLYLSLKGWGAWPVCDRKSAEEIYVMQRQFSGRWSPREFLG